MGNKADHVSQVFKARGPHKLSIQPYKNGEAQTLRILGMFLLAFKWPTSFNVIDLVGYSSVRHPALCSSHAKMSDGRLNRFSYRLKGARTTQSDLSTAGLMPNKPATSDRIRRLKDSLEDKEIENQLFLCDFVLHLTADGSQRFEYFRFLKRLERCIKILSVRYNGLLDKNNTLVQRVLNTRCQIEQLSAQEMLDVRNTTGGMASLSPKDVMKNISSLNLAVRDDGSVDWDETLASNRSSSGFSLEFFKRFRGEEHGAASHVVTVPQTEEVKELQNVSKSYESRLQELLYEEQTIKERVFQARMDGQLTAEDVVTLTGLNSKIEELSKLSTLSRLNLDMQRICVYLEQELSETQGYLTDLKLLVAEAALKEQQLTNLMEPVAQELKQAVQEQEEDGLATVLVDDDELSLISSGLDDLKSRLGIDGSRIAVDWGTTGKVVRKLVTWIAKSSVSAYWSLRLLVSDFLCAGNLVRKGASGYKLKPREVQTVWRFFKDVATVVPFTIIMLVPITPWGHLFVFRLIQQKAPDLWPSCFSEKRLKLQQLLYDVSNREDDLLKPRGRGNMTQILKGTSKRLFVWCQRKIVSSSRKLLTWSRIQLKNRQQLSNSTTAGGSSMRRQIVGSSRKLLDWTSLQFNIKKQLSNSTTARSTIRQQVIGSSRKLLDWTSGRFEKKAKLSNSTTVAGSSMRQQVISSSRKLLALLRFRKKTRSSNATGEIG